MKIAKILIRITVPIVLIMLFTSLLSTKQYLLISKGMYSSHEEIEFDHDYAADRIMGYLNYRYDDLLCDESISDNCYYMRDTEIRHMVDVKNIFTMFRIAGLSSLIIAVSLSYFIYRKDKKEFYNTYKYIYVGPALFISFVGGYILIDFNTAFTVFHKLLFTNDDWILYADDVLIQLLPTTFWMVSGLLILLGTALSFGLIYFLNEKYCKE